LDFDPETDGCEEAWARAVALEGGAPGRSMLVVSSRRQPYALLLPLRHVSRDLAPVRLRETAGSTMLGLFACD
jgi:hypothetical protein